MNFWSEYKGELIVMAIMIIAIVAIICIPYYIGAGRQAEIINAEYGTDYTAADFFWAGSTIEEIIVGDQHNIDLKEVK